MGKPFQVNAVQASRAAQARTAATATAPARHGAFAAALRDSLRGRAAEPPAVRGPEPSVRLSRHASERLAERGLALSPLEAGKLDQALDAAARKGGRESLVLMDRMALVVSVPNRTVITAVPRGGEPAVFTNIDSAVVV